MSGIVSSRWCPAHVPHAPLVWSFAWLCGVVVTGGLTPLTVDAGILTAGAAKVDITHDDAGPVNDRLYATAVAITDETTTLILVGVDAVAIGEIGSITNEYLPQVRAAVRAKLGIDPASILINASHCHGIVHPDVAARTVQAIVTAWEGRVPVKVAVGSGHEDRIMENRRLILKDGREADVRHAYSLPADAQVAAVGPVDPEIGLMRLDRLNGSTLAVLFNFACHPIQGVPSGGNTADLSGFAARTLETAYGPDTTALFLQGCGGDINPIRYKQTDEPRDAEALGQRLGVSALAGVKPLASDVPSVFRRLQRIVTLPRCDNAERIAALEAEQLRLVDSLQGTSLNLKSFLPLIMKQGLDAEHPSYASHRYLRERQQGRDDLLRLDAENRRNVAAYLRNIETMEELTRLKTNLALLRKHQARNVAAGSRTIDVEVAAFRLGAFRLVTFPGELTVQIGLNLKERAPATTTFVAGYTNGYIYYAPTADQLRNVGGAQEDSDCLLAPEWQERFETAALELLRELE